MNVVWNGTGWPEAPAKRRASSSMLAGVANDKISDRLLACTAAGACQSEVACVYAACLGGKRCQPIGATYWPLSTTPAYPPTPRQPRQR